MPSFLNLVSHLDSGSRIVQLTHPFPDFSNCSLLSLSSRFRFRRSCRSEELRVSIIPRETKRHRSPGLRSLDLPNGQIQPTAEFDLLDLCRLWVLRRICGRDESTSLLEDGDARGHIPFPTAALPPYVEGAHGSVGEIECRTFSQSQQSHPTNSHDRTQPRRHQTYLPKLLIP